MTADFPEPRAASMQAVERFAASVRRTTETDQRRARAVHALDTLVDECQRLGFSQVAGATGAARFAEALELIDHTTYLDYVQRFHHVAK